MFGINSSELVIILIVALILIGPQKLPDLMKAFGKGVSEFRRMSSDVRTTIQREIERAEEAKRIEETKKELFGDDTTETAQAEAPAAAADKVAAQEAPKGQETASAQPVQAQATVAAESEKATAAPAADETAKASAAPTAPEKNHA